MKFEEMKKKAEEVYEKYTQLPKEDRLVVDGVMMGLSIKNQDKEDKK